MHPDESESTAATTAVASIGRKAGRGLRWSMFGTLASRAGTFVLGLILARILVPADFGMFAIALAAMHFVMHVNDVGIIAATVQWRGKLEEMAPTAASMAMLFSTGVYAVFWVLAPFYAELSGTPDAAPLVRLLTAVILVDGVTAVRSAALMRRFQHDRLTKANLVGIAVNAPLAITLAANGAGAYSLVVGQLAGSLVTGVLVFVLAGVPVRFGIDRQIAKRLLRFGLPLALSLGIEAVLLNADYVIVGHALGPVAVGFYLLAFNVSSWVPTLVGTAVRYVSVPAFSRLAEHDPGTLSAGVRRSVSLVFAGVLPVAVLMAVMSEAVIGVLYGHNWTPSASALRALAVLAIVRMLTGLAVDTLTAAAATRWTVWLNLGWATALVPALIIGTRVDGIRGAAIAHAVVALAVAGPLAVFALNHVGVRLTAVLPTLGRPLFGGVAAAAVMLLGPASDADPVVQLVMAGGGGLVLYTLIVVPRTHLKALGTRVGELAATRSS